MNKSALFLPKKHALAFLAFLFAMYGNAQYRVIITVKNEDNRQALSGASVVIEALKKGVTTDSAGIAIVSGLPAGNFKMQISYVGFTSVEKTIHLPGAYQMDILLEKKDDDDDPDVIITATRTDRSVRNTPTRVEVIAGGEIAENSSMRPGEIKMLLNETTGITTQPTSAINGTANLRIQGLDGRYTQLLRDGLPLYSGLSEGLNVVQIAPLDLQQVEIIKGASSTLYGGGAITGLINLVSKTPGEKPVLDFLINGSSAGGLDFSGFYSKRHKQWGLTLFAASSSNKAYDPAATGFTAIPQFGRYTLAPRLFYYGKKDTVTAGISFLNENRTGGSIDYIEHGSPGYFEKNHTSRYATQFNYRHRFNTSSSLQFKNSFNHFNRKISLPAYTFEGFQQNSFTELSVQTGRAAMQWVAGANLYTDRFTEMPHNNPAARNYDLTTFGGFVQNSWSPSGTCNLETGLRFDHTSPFGWILLPRVAALFRLSHQFSIRAGGGLGYKVPTLFTEESEERQYQAILPIDQTHTRYEKSAGASFDITCNFSLDEIRLSVNPLLFYTRIQGPLVLMQSGAQYAFTNAIGYADTKGIDFSTRISWEAVKLYTGYSYTLAEHHFNGMETPYPLAPRHKLHFDLVYEIEHRLRIAAETYYTSKQALTDGSEGRAYWLFGVLVEKSWRHFSLFVNAEDLGNVRQTDWGAVFGGSVNAPLFKEVYAPLEGRIVNAGLKIKLY